MAYQLPPPPPPPPSQGWPSSHARPSIQQHQPYPFPRHHQPLPYLHPGSQGPPPPRPHGMPPPSVNPFGSHYSMDAWDLPHHPAVSARGRSLWAACVDGRFDTVDDLLLALNRYGRVAGYAFVKRRSCRYRDGQATKYTLACDKGNKRPSQATVRQRTTDKTDCHFLIQADMDGGKWRAELYPGLDHNHPPSDEPHRLRYHKRRARLQRTGAIEPSPEPEPEPQEPQEPPMEGIRIVLELRPTADRFLEVNATMDQIPSRAEHIMGRSFRLPIPADEINNIDISILRKNRLIVTDTPLPPPPPNQQQPVQSTQSLQIPFSQPRGAAPPPPVCATRRPLSSGTRRPEPQVIEIRDSEPPESTQQGSDEEVEEEEEYEDEDEEDDSTEPTPS